MKCNVKMLKFMCNKTYLLNKNLRWMVNFSFQPTKASENFRLQKNFRYSV